MAEDHTITLASHDQAQGNIQISPQVLEIILGIAAKSVKGVYAMRGNLTNNLNQFLGRKDHGRGVVISVDDDQRLKADVYVYFDYGISVPQVALKMQETLQEQLLFMTDLTLDEVNIHVEGVVPPKEDKSSDSSPVFDEASALSNFPEMKQNGAE